VSFEDDVKINIDKRGKVINIDKTVYEYDIDGRLIKMYILNSDGEYNGQYCQKLFQDGKIIFLLKTSYLNGKMHGLYEVYKYCNDALYYSERSTYLNGLLEGSEMIKQTYSKSVLTSFYFYKTGLKHGPFKLSTYAKTTEGNYKNGKLDGFVTVTLNDNTSTMHIYQDGIEI